MPKKDNQMDINAAAPIVKQAVKYVKAGKALDLGSGIGRNTIFLAKKGFNVTAVDSNVEIITGLKALVKLMKLKVKVERGDAVAFKPTQQYDIILSNMVLHFINDAGKNAIIKKMQEHTKPDGVNVLTSWTEKNRKHTRPYPLKTGALKKWYSKPGWKILFYEEEQGPAKPDPFNPGKTRRIWVARIIAQKI